MKKLLFVGLMAVVLTGAGCASAEGSEVEFTRYDDQETSVSFDVPAGSTLHDGVNGFEEIWKFTYDGDSYLIRYDIYMDGSAIYGGWDGKQPEGAADVNVEHLDGKVVYAREGQAETQAYFTDGDEIVSIFVGKHEGETLTGDRSSDDDEMYQHLVDSITLKGERAF